MKYLDIMGCREGEDPIHTWPAVSLDGGNVRLCYTPRMDKGGFDFYVATFVEGHGTGMEGVWQHPDTTAECICRGIAYFDGIRHLWWGDPQTDNEGYLYYERPERLIAVLVELRRLESIHCLEDAIS